MSVILFGSRVPSMCSEDKGWLRSDHVCMDHKSNKCPYERKRTHRDTQKVMWGQRQKLESTHACQRTPKMPATIEGTRRLTWGTPLPRLFQIPGLQHCGGLYLSWVKLPVCSTFTHQPWETKTAMNLNFFYHTEKANKIYLCARWGLCVTC